MYVEFPTLLALFFGMLSLSRKYPRLSGQNVWLSVSEKNLEILSTNWKCETHTSRQIFNNGEDFLTDDKKLKLNFEHP